jgi:ATP-dependent exoDNAse (exonuclease V) beta subunit|tara:strand:- start:696 stop:1382 length:687 start_codon:yes stop_codon:yes gene_type:complete
VKLIRKYDYPSSTRASIEGLRHYNIDGSTERLPSVTTVLSGSQEQSKRDSLQRWRDKVGAAEAAKITAEAAARGTSMHLYLENYCLGQGYLDMTDVGNVAKHMAEKIVDKGIDNRLTEIYGNEATLYYPGLYAGSVDLVGQLDGKITIIDFKQTNKPKQREWIGDYFLQMAAYGMAHDAVYDTAIEQGVILMCSKDLYYQEFKIEGEEYRQAKHEFLRRLDQFHKNKV